VSRRVGEEWDEFQEAEKGVRVAVRQEEGEGLLRSRARGRSGVRPVDLGLEVGQPVQGDFLSSPIEAIPPVVDESLQIARISAGFPS